jgi:hypothetical protein
VATIVVHTDGTLGDHLPFIELGRRLAARGHRVRLAINRAMHPWAQRSGLEAVALTDVDRGEEEARRNARAWNHWAPAGAGPEEGGPLPPADLIVRQSLELAGLCRGADLLVATAIRIQGRVAHELTGVPWVTASMNPWSFAAEEDEGVAAAERQGSLTQFHALRAQVAEAYRAAGVVRPLPEWSKTWQMARHVLLASSPRFSRPDPAALQPRHSLDLTGFWFYEDPEWAAWRPGPGLEEFMRRRPLVLAFSSQPLEDARRALLLHVEAAALVGLPLLVQRGWAGFSEADLPPSADRAQVRFEGFLPQDWLFARAAAAIQHGGIGSIARALRQGCPVLVEPYGNDQLYNARRVRELGIGAAVHPFRATAATVARALRERVLSAPCRERAERLGAHVAAERGVEEACRLIEACAARAEADDGRPAWRVPTLREIAAGSGPAAAPSAPASCETAIPRVVHQTWKGREVPEELRDWHRSWGARNPGWEVRLWTDEECRDLVRREYPWFLAVYDEYPEAIMRADAARYFILHRHGGVYADLDFECLRPLGPLLAGKGLVLGLEPELHRAQHFPLPGGLGRIVCNAFMASVPGHPFWEHVHRLLVGSHREPAVLDATGPFLLTRAVESWPGRERISLEPPALLYPITSGEAWDGLPETVRGLIAETAFAVHHWRGGWWTPPGLTPSPAVGLLTVVRGVPGGGVASPAERLEALAAALDPPPLVSCLMVTRERPALARRAAASFLRQTWAARELVIVDDGPGDELERFVAGLGDARVRLVRLPDEGRPLGELRNRAVAEARGAYVAQWDDDDLSDPHRLSVMLGALTATGADAAILQRQVLWWPAKRRLGVSGHRLWEGTLLAARAVLPAYPGERRGEDTPVVEAIERERRLTVVEAPWLAAYTRHGGNTFGEVHFEGIWRAATAVCPAAAYEAAVRELEGRMAGSVAAESPAPRGAPEPGVAAEGGAPKVLVLVPVRDALPHLPGLVANLAALQWPKDRLGLAFLEGDSLDLTAAWIEERLAGLRGTFARAELHRRDFGWRSGGPRWEPAEQLRRRGAIARARNLLLSRALRDEEWVLWVDADLARWPADVLARLVAAGKDIVVPHCRSLETGGTFDANTWRLSPDAARVDWSAWTRDGLLQPPRGLGRLYLGDLAERDLVEVDAVGGTMLLVRADLHRQGLVFPPFPYKGLIETEGLAAMARDMGVSCWGMPRLEVWHP